MPRFTRQHTEAVNSDSFLDIVASVVSIMIMMVVMEGTRIKNAPLTVAIPSSPESVELEKDVATEQGLTSDVQKTVEELRSLEQEVVKRGMQRDAMVTVVSAVEHKLEEHRQRLDQSKRTDFDTTRNLSEAKYQLGQLLDQVQDVSNSSGEPIVVESYPTPISRAVDGPEEHLLISNGRVAFIPLDPLLKELEASAKRQIYKLSSQSELSDTVGPIEGFRLRYRLERHDATPETVRQTGRGGSYARLEKWSLIPVASDIGEPVRLAMEPSSSFHHALSKILPGRTTITIWVYPDGFEAFRQIRKELYRLGYTIAARPLTEGTPISGSPEGSKSAAQ